MRLLGSYVWGFCVETSAVTESHIWLQSNLETAQKFRCKVEMTPVLLTMLQGCSAGVQHHLSNFLSHLGDTPNSKSSNEANLNYSKEAEEDLVIDRWAMLNKFMVDRWRGAGEWPGGALAVGPKFVTKFRQVQCLLPHVFDSLNVACSFKISDRAFRRIIFPTFS